MGSDTRDSVEHLTLKDICDRGMINGFLFTLTGTTNMAFGKSVAFLLLFILLFTLVPETQASQASEKTAQTGSNSPQAQGTGASSTDDSAKISPEKRELIKQIIALSDAHKRTEVVSESVFAQSEKNFISGMSASIGNSPDYSDAQKTELITRLTLSSARFFDRCRELMKQKINLAEIVDSVTYPIYDKYFEQADLEALVTFYKSPIGEKFVKVMPQIYQESSAKTNEILIPKIQEVIRQAADEERAGTKNPTSD